MRKVAVMADSIGCISARPGRDLRDRDSRAEYLLERSVYRDWLGHHPRSGVRVAAERPGGLLHCQLLPPGDLADTYRKISETAESLLFATVSSKVSTLHNAAIAAKGC